MSQNLMDIDYVSPFNDDLAAIKKGTQWAFIDVNGKVAVNFRDDLVASYIENSSYPIFNNERCLIEKKQDGISYFGYIDKTGKTVIEPQFLNAANFKNGVAIALELKMETLGTNNLLGKSMVSYDYFEVIIDDSGKILHYVSSEPTHISLSNKKLKNTPKINSKFISDNLVITKSESGKWSIKKLN